MPARTPRKTLSRLTAISRCHSARFVSTTDFRETHAGVVDEDVELSVARDDVGNHQISTRLVGDVLASCFGFQSGTDRGRRGVGLSASMSVIVTDAPSRANSCAAARSIPRAAPVIRTLLPEKRII